jgi:hypothetical protein
VAADATCTISGLSAGRRFVAKIFATASARRASAPSPYTVSVGNATQAPARIAAAASASAAAVAASATAGSSLPAANVIALGSQRSTRVSIAAREEKKQRENSCRGRLIR